MVLVLVNMPVSFILPIEANILIIPIHEFCFEVIVPIQNLRSHLQFDNLYPFCCKLYYKNSHYCSIGSLPSI